MWILDVAGCRAKAHLAAAQRAPSAFNHRAPSRLAEIRTRRKLSALFSEGEIYIPFLGHARGRAIPLISFRNNGQWALMLPYDLRGVIYADGILRRQVPKPLLGQKRRFSGARYIGLEGQSFVRFRGFSENVGRGRVFFCCRGTVATNILE